MEFKLRMKRSFSRSRVVCNTIMMMIILIFRAPLDAMRTAATMEPSMVDGTSGMHSNLVDNAQPIGLTEKPDSNVWPSRSFKQTRRWYVSNVLFVFFFFSIMYKRGSDECRKNIVMLLICEWRMTIIVSTAKCAKTRQWSRLFLIFPFICFSLVFFLIIVFSSLVKSTAGCL